MKNVSKILSILSLILFVGSTAWSQSENKAKIKIKKNVNGVETIIEEDVDLNDGKKLEDLLKEYGIDVDLSNSDGNKVIEIIVDDNTSDSKQNMRLNMNGNHWNFNGDHDSKAFLGVMLTEEMEIENINGEETKTSEGVILKEIIEGTAAAESELQAGDKILELNDQTIKTVNEFIDIINNMNPGDALKIEYERDGKKKKTNVNLGERKHENKRHMMFFGDDDNEFDFDIDIDEDDFNWESDDNRANKFFFKTDDDNGAFLGVYHERDTEEGISISSVVKESSAEKMGMQAGDVITAIDQTPVKSFGDLIEFLDDAEVGQAVSVNILRDGKAMTLNGELGKEKSGCNINFGPMHIKGMGNIFDSESMEEWAEQLKEGAEQIEVWAEEHEGEWDEMANDFEAKHAEMMDRLAQRLEGMENHREHKSIRIMVMIDEISPEEVETVNQNANPQLKIDNDLELNDVSFYPNPNNGIFNLELNVENRGDLNLMIYDDKGNIVYREMLSDFEGDYRNEIDITTRANGNYYLQVEQNGKTFSKKIIKQ